MVVKNLAKPRFSILHLFGGVSWTMGAYLALEQIGVIQENALIVNIVVAGIGLLTVIFVGRYNKKHEVN